MKLLKAIFDYNQVHLELQPGKVSFQEELYVDFKKEEIPGGHLIKLMIHPKKEVIIKQLVLEFELEVENISRFYCNGYQSWSESREYKLEESIRGLKWMVSPFAKNIGDYTFCKYKNVPGNLHSWSYTYLKTKENRTIFLGSLSENSGFTLIQTDTKKRILAIKKDCDNLKLSHSYPAFEILILNGTLEDSLSKYFKSLEVAPPSVPKAAGWTSWYKYYNRIDKPLLMNELNSWSTYWNANIHKNQSFIFQIDDGYQSAIGDWLLPNVKFKGSVESLAIAAHQVGFKAGLWLAPFVVEKKSWVFQNKPDWILKDEKGNPFKVGYNPYWKGWFYALDFYHDEVQSYLREVLLTILQRWNFDLVKLDFLYAVAVLPRDNKTRGQIMHEAMEFLRNVTQGKLLLACGVPLSAAFGKADYCRIGPDVHLSWEHKFLKACNLRERLSTYGAIQNSINRLHLNEHAFRNDPDVLMLRGKGNHLTLSQRKALSNINSIAGGVLFTSDNPDDWDAATQYDYQLLIDNFYKSRNVKIDLDRNGDFAVRFDKNNQFYTIKGKL